MRVRRSVTLPPFRPCVQPLMTHDVVASTMNHYPAIKKIFDGRQKGLYASLSALVRGPAAPLNSPPEHHPLTP